MTDFRDRWSILAVLCLARTAMGYQFQAIASVSGRLVRDMGFSYAEIGTLIGLYMLPGAAVALLGGALAARFGDKVLAVAGLAMMTLGDALVVAFPAPETLFAGRIVAGAGGVIFNVVVTKMVADWFVGREIVTAMALTAATWPLGIAVGLVAHGPAAAVAGWPGAMATTGVLAAAATILVAARYRPPPTAGAAPAGRIRGVRPSLRELLLVSLAGFVWTVLNIGLACYFSFAPDLLADRGATPRGAAVLVSAGLWASLVAIPLGGYLAERLRRPNAAIVLFTLMAGASLFLMPYAGLPLLWCLVIGIGIGPPAGAIMALPSEVLRPESRATGLGVFFTWYYAGMAVGPVIAGWGRDVTGSAATPVLIGGAFFASVSVCLFLFRTLQARAPK